jgi:TonB family protein
VEERISLDAIVEQRPQRGGISIAVAASVVLHALLIVWFVTHYHPVAASDTATTPIARYVELMRQNPRDFTEAPGKKIDRAPITAPLSDANRKASMPKPTGDKPTTRPGDANTAIYTPPTPPRGDGRQPSAAQPAISQPAAAPNGREAQSAPDQSLRNSDSTFVYHPQQANANGRVDWQNAIKEVGKIASLGAGQHGMDLGQAGGEKGYAENGPLSFETQWYDWGEYAESMVSKIRVNWYANMPELLRTGVKGVVTIRFTIHRDGSITDITILSQSGIPPYDFAARKAIELSSPLKPLPLDFPNNTERVTCMFFYNMEPPRR